MGLTGNYSGSANIKILLASFVGKFSNFSVSNEHQSVETKGSGSLVDSTFDFQGFSTVVGKINATVVAQDQYELAGGSWLIGREVWNFTRFNEQFPVT